MKIVFCHNVHLRYKTLFDTLKIEKQLFPDSYSIVAYNDSPPPTYVKQFKDVTFIPFKGVTHKIGCTNGCIVSIQEALKHNPDVIVFSHDDVFISQKYLHIFNRHSESIWKGFYDFIGRIPGGGVYGKNYMMMECFFISAKAAKISFGEMTPYIDESDIVRDVRGSISPEVFLFEAINKPELKLLTMEYEHKLEGYNETLESLMGFHHLNAGKRGWI